MSDAADKGSSTTRTLPPSPDSPRCASWSITWRAASSTSPEEVEVEEISEPDALVFELKVAEQDLGKVIGKQGRTRQGAAHDPVGRLREDAPPRHPRDPRVAAPGRRGWRAGWLRSGDVCPSACSAGRTACAATSTSGRTTRGAARSTTSAQLLIVQDGPHAAATQVTSMRPVADGYLAHLAGVDNREAAAALTLARGAGRARGAAAARGRASTSSRTSSAARSRTTTAARWAS